MPVENTSTHEVTVYANVNGKYKSIGAVNIESSIDIHPSEEICIGDMEIDYLKNGNTAEISFHMIDTRELFRMIYPPMATNNWRKYHGLPMWRK